MQKEYGDDLFYTPVPSQIVSMMIDGYFRHCRYLTSAEIAYDNKNFAHARGDFKIGSCCYCTGTGHFNASELPLCFNQLGYSMFAAGVENGYFLELGMHSAKEFLSAQRNRCFIAKIEKILFKKPINPKDFFGSVDIVNVSKCSGNCFYRINSSFYDSREGKASASFLIAVTDKPLYPVKQVPESFSFVRLYSKLKELLP